MSIRTTIPTSMSTIRSRPRTGAPVTHARDGGLVLFHIGMTVHRPWRPDLWLPVVSAMPAMLSELERARAAARRGDGPDPGFLGAETLLGARGPWVVQYWADLASLHAYAHPGGGPHRTAWSRFSRTARRHPGAIGIWHETYVVDAGGVETFYSGGADVGLGRVGGTVPVRRRGATARERLGSTV